MLCSSPACVCETLRGAWVGRGANVNALFWFFVISYQGPTVIINKRGVCLARTIEHSKVDRTRIADAGVIESRCVWPSKDGEGYGRVSSPLVIRTQGYIGPVIGRWIVLKTSRRLSKSPSIRPRRVVGGMYRCKDARDWIDMTHELHGIEPLKGQVSCPE